MAPVAPRLCHKCNVARAVLKRPKNHDQLCRECFYEVLEEEVHQTIINQKLFKRGERLALAASGGKDSTVLAHIVSTLNKRYNYGLDLFLLSIDEGIAGYRDDSLDTVRRNEQTYGIPLVVVSYKQLYGWTMDDIVRQIGTKNNCTFCGVFRRQALDRGAVLACADKIATGHNADDVAETVLLNILRGDVPRLSRCVSAITGGEEGGGLPRVKPFKYTYEKEIVMYAYFKKLDYFSTECVYAPFAARGFARDFVKDLEAARPSAILDLIRSAEDFRFTMSGPSQPRGSVVVASALEHGKPSNGVLADSTSSPEATAPATADKEGSGAEARTAGHASSSSNKGMPPMALPTPSTVARAPPPRQCERCGYLASQPVCKACVLLEGLNKGRPGGLSPWAPQPLVLLPSDQALQRNRDDAEQSSEYANGRSRSWEDGSSQQGAGAVAPAAGLQATVAEASEVASQEAEAEAVSHEKQTAELAAVGSADKGPKRSRQVVIQYDS